MNIQTFLNALLDFVVGSLMPSITTCRSSNLFQSKNSRILNSMESSDLEIENVPG